MNSTTNQQTHQFADPVSCFNEALDMISNHCYQDAIQLLSPLLDDHSSDKNKVKQHLAQCFKNISHRSLNRICELENTSPTADAIHKRLERLNNPQPKPSECLACGDFVPVRFKSYREGSTKGRICLICDELF